MAILTMLLYMAYPPAQAPSLFTSRRTEDATTISSLELLQSQYSFLIIRPWKPWSTRSTGRWMRQAAQIQHRDWTAFGARARLLCKTSILRCPFLDGPRIPCSTGLHVLTANFSRISRQYCTKRIGSFMYLASSAHVPMVSNLNLYTKVLPH